MIARVIRYRKRKERNWRKKNRLREIVDRLEKREKEETLKKVRGELLRYGSRMRNFRS